MKFSKEALGIALVAVLGTAPTLTSGFTAPAATTTITTVQLALSPPSPGISTRSFVLGFRAQPSLARGSIVFRKLAAGDDEEDDDELEGPLSKGVDSVSWLPTVIGAKSVESPGDSSEEVSKKAVKDNLV